MKRWGGAGLYQGMKHFLVLATALAAAPGVASASSACALDSETGDACTTVAPPTIPTPPGMGDYCSSTFADGTWAFNSARDLVHDPCSSAGAGATIAKAGLYSLDNENYVVTRCNGGIVDHHAGLGQGPLTAAFNNAVAWHARGCTFTVSPQALPIFDSPFSLDEDDLEDTNYHHATGFDHVRPPFNSVPVEYPNTYGMTSITDSYGYPRDWVGYIDNHAGNDYIMNEWTPIYAVADGVVDMERFRDVSGNKDRPDCTGTQGEIYIRHKVSGGVNARYEELFESYYAHIEQGFVRTGQVVHRGQLIAFSGNTGCTNGAWHLHFGVMRMSNTAGRRLYPLVINQNFVTKFDSDNGNNIVVDPDGYTRLVAAAFDPWAYLGVDASHDWGAISPKLWIDGQEPPVEPASIWTPAGNQMVW